MNSKIRLIFLSLFISISFSAIGQKISVSVQSPTRIEVTNNLGFTHKFKIVNTQNGVDISQDQLIEPNGTKNFDVTLSRYSVKNYQVVALYDKTTYENDLRLIERMHEYREKERQNNIMWEAFRRALDQYITGGKIYNVIDKAETVINILNGKPVGELAEDYLVGLVEEKVVDQIDKREAKAAAVAAFKLKELFQEGDYQDLKKITDICFVRLMQSKQSIPDEQKVLFKNFVRVSVKNKLELEVTAPVKTEYNYLQSPEPLYGDYQKVVLPFSARLSYSWYPQLNGGTNYYFMLAYSQSPFMYKTTSDIVYLKNKGYSFNHSDAGFGLNYNFIRGISVFGEIACRVNWENSYSYKLAGQEITNLVKTNNEFKFANVNPLFSAGVRIDLNYFSIVGKYCNTLEITDNTNNQNKLLTDLSVVEYQVGIAIPLRKGLKYY